MNVDPYVKQVAKLGDDHEIIANEDILNADGVSLIKKGTRIDSSIYDKLVRHKLLRSIDDSLSLADPVTPLGLVGVAKTLLSEEPELVNAVDDRIAHRDILPILGAVRLEPPIAVKLTVCRERSIERFHHQIRVALIALHIASRLKWAHDDMIDLATAAILHDLGELHIEPSLFENTKSLNASERKQIYAHPSIAFLFLREFPVYRRKISEIVHQHHERLDGSGYPKGLSGDDILPAARLLGAAELLTVVRLEHHKGITGTSSISDILTFNTERFGNEFILPLLEAANRIEKDEAVRPVKAIVDKKVLKQRLLLLAETLRGIEAVNTPGQQDANRFVSSQMERIGAMAKRSGIDLTAPTEFLEIVGSDTHALSELDVLTKEMMFLTHTTAREGLRRWDKPEQTAGPLIEWLKHVDENFQRLTVQSGPIAEA